MPILENEGYVLCRTQIATLYILLFGDVVKRNVDFMLKEFLSKMFKTIPPRIKAMIEAKRRILT
ncbi:Hypothetical protein FKW44_005546 [Caligus rogercresseyi]|uniref:Uncharacterized protein n=1 Tax=Caligus rogercresseyi TaxID=217165 RepID=A0A7T8KC42_CALRO|nr:Hypothetical protein FKW44_005546 [Caligus rogercresseyi]